MKEFDQIWIRDKMHGRFRWRTPDGEDGEQTPEDCAHCNLRKLRNAT